MRITVTLIGLLFGLTLSAQISFNGGQGTYSLSTGGTSVMMTGANALYGNQAGMVLSSGMEIIASAERRFALSDLSTYSVAAMKSMSFGNIGLLISTFGIDEYKEQKIGLAYARKLTDKLSIGGQLDYIDLRVQNYGNQSIITFELGVYTKLTRDFHIGAHVYSPGSIKVGEQNEVSTIYGLGVKYLASQKLNVMVEASKVIDETVSFRVGADYTFSDLLGARFGISTEPNLFSVGIVLHLEKFDIEIGNSYHTLLGNTPGLSLSYKK